MKLVYEDEYGAYSGVRPEFLKKFIFRENNPNFEVYDSQDNNNRFIAVKPSRLPDDQDLATSRYGINFHRAKPELQEAFQYGDELPHALESRKWLAKTAFAAATEEEYDKKSSTREHFYSYIWGLTPQTIWVTPHSGNVARAPDEILPYPKVEMDSFTAGVAASCAFNNRNKASVISSNYLFPARYVGKILRISEKIGHGQLHSALQIECLKLYLARDPELVANMILDIKNELLD